MKKVFLWFSIALIVAAGCGASPARPNLSSIAQKWEKVPEGMEAPVVFTLPGGSSVQTATVEYTRGRAIDVYYPSGFDFGKPAPVVVFVMGYSSEFTMNWFGAKLKDLGQYVSWGQLVAASGMIGVAYETDFPDDDIETVLRYILANGADLGMDPKRIALFGCSGNTLTALGALTAKSAEYHDSLRCGVIFYPVISYFMNTGEQVMPAPFKRELRRDLPIYMVTVGNDRPEWTQAVSAFLATTQGQGYPLEVAHYDRGVHGFDTDQDSDESRTFIARALAFMKKHLQ